MTSPASIAAPVARGTGSHQCLGWIGREPGLVEVQLGEGAVRGLAGARARAGRRGKQALWTAGHPYDPLQSKQTLQIEAPRHWRLQVVVHVSERDWGLGKRVRISKRENFPSPAQPPAERILPLCRVITFILQSCEGQGGQPQHQPGRNLSPDPLSTSAKHIVIREHARMHVRAGGEGRGG